MQFYARPEHAFFVPHTDRFVGCRHIKDDTWSYQKEPHTVPDDAPEAREYAEGCRAGAIYAADEDTARKCGAAFVALTYAGESTGYVPVPAMRAPVSADAAGDDSVGFAQKSSHRSKAVP